MALISADDQKFLKDKFAKDLVDPVNITLFTQGESPLTVPSPECAYCKDTRELLEEIDALSDKINLKVYDFVGDAEQASQMGVDKIPAVILDSDAGMTRGGKRVRYYGIPSGYEFSSLIEDIIDLSQHATKLAAETKDSLQKLQKDIHIQVFVTPT